MLGAAAEPQREGIVRSSNDVEPSRSKSFGFRSLALLQEHERSTRHQT